MVKQFAIKKSHHRQNRGSDWGVRKKMVFLKISQILQENTCVGVSF